MSSNDGTGNLVGSSPHVKKKHTGRWSNVSMDVNNKKNGNEHAAEVRK
jgi:hypothetical protein